MRYLLFAGFILISACFAPTDAQDNDIPDDFPINVEDMKQFDEADADAVIGSINPLENDLRGIEVAIRMHQGFLIKPEGSVFNLGVKDGAGETRLDEAFVLIEADDVALDNLIREQRDSFRFWTYRLDPADYPRMQAGDAVLQELKRTAPGENQLTFNAQAFTCANPDLETPDQYRIAMFVRTASDVDFVPMSAGDLVVDKDNAGVFAFAWEPCAF